MQPDLSDMQRYVTTWPLCFSKQRGFLASLISVMCLLFDVKFK